MCATQYVFESVSLFRFLSPGLVWPSLYPKSLPSTLTQSHWRCCPALSQGSWMSWSGGIPGQAEILLGTPQMGGIPYTLMACVLFFLFLA